MTVTLHVEVTNRAPQSATDVVLSLPLPAGVAAEPDAARAAFRLLPPTPINATTTAPIDITTSRLPGADIVVRPKIRPVSFRVASHKQ
jgi:uncharacterized repeat protein (TIGR01451 family)